jgi:hypothetical protein
MTGDAIKTLDEAIGAGDAILFTKQISRLTDDCNGCHAALNHGYVVIKVPDHSAFQNQDFRTSSNLRRHDVRRHEVAGSGAPALQRSL